ncbi:Nuclear pore complex subunit [Tieghemiomyces parasiticus]|uniref:Nuclear pore complex subunit n=1 Tax=Tieghemiomyces parasiticus TaxID=78921 RepID=A0A9W8AD43_9FUNG|nr:Nuclear pore complex subunit [Tieghemiomyces parasiticus]
MVDRINRLAGSLSSLDYTRLAVPILERRFQDVLWLSAGFAVAVATLLQVKLGDRLFHPFAHYHIMHHAYAASTLALVMYVLTRLNSDMCHVERRTHSSRVVKLQLFTMRPTWTVIGVYALSALATTYVYCRWFLHGHLPMTLHPTGDYGPRILAPARAMVTVGAVAAGALYGAQVVWTERYHLRFSTVHQTRLFAIKGQLPTLVARAVTWTWLFVRWFWLAYLVLGPLTYRIHAGFIYASSDLTLIPPVGNPIWSPGTLLHLFSAVCLAILCFEAQLAIFETVFTDPAEVAVRSSDPNACLSRGLAIREPTLPCYLAFYELARLSRFSPERRDKIFRDIDRPLPMAQELLDHCFAVIDRALADLQEKTTAATASPKIASRADTAVATPSANSTTSPPAPILTDGLPRRRTGAFINELVGGITKGSPSDATNGPTSKSSDTTSPAPASAAKPILAAKPPRNGVDPVLDATPKTMDGYLFNLVVSLLKRSAIGKELLMRFDNDATLVIFGDFQVQMWAIQAIGDLIYHSVREDTYGGVQRQVDGVLERLVAYLLALEEFSQEPYYLKGATADDRAAHVLFRHSQHQRVQRQAFALIQALQTTVYLIVTEYYEHLHQYKFSPQCAKKLQRFSQFHE